MPASKLLNFRVPVNLQKELEELSRRKHVPISELLRDSLREFLAVHKFRSLSKSARKYARKTGFVTDEDIMGLEE